MKLKISWLWIPFFFLGLVSGMMKTMLFLFFMLTIHEMAHILVAKVFQYPVEQIIVYPFGLCAKMRYIGMGCVWKELFIILAGPCMHLCFPFVFQILATYGLISASYLDYLLLMNRSILVFNLLPVFPLDGGRILQSLYHFVFRYTTAQRLTMITSIINLTLLFYYQILQTWSAYFVMGFLLMQIIFTWKGLAIERLQFYHYRKAHPVNYRIRMNTKHDLYRANTNVVKEGDGWIMEEEWLRYYFHENEPLLVHTIFL